MELWQIEHFLGIVRYGTMTAAAKELHISQSALSSGLKSLEQELGCPLFDRIGKRLVLNDEGRYFIKQAESVEALLRETTLFLKNHTNLRDSTVNCALGTPVGNPGALVAGFKQAYPNYTLRIGFTLAGAFSVFSQSDTDIAIKATPLHIDDESAELLGTEAYAMALPAQHPLASRKAVRLADFKDEPLIASIGGQSISCFNPTALCQEAGFLPRIACEVQWHTDAMALVEAGVGCCIVPEYTWLANYSYNLAVRPISDVVHHRHIYAQIANHKTPTPATRAFLFYLKSYAAELAQ